MALRRQLAVLSGAEKEASLCWLQHAEICRATGHFEAAMTASLQTLARKIPGAEIEHARLLWDMGERDRAIQTVQQVRCKAHDATNSICMRIALLVTNMPMSKL